MSNLITRLLRVILGGVFVFAGCLKILNPQLFAHEIDQYSLVPGAAINLFAITLPWIELIAGLLLVFGLWVRASALIVAGMTTAFFFAIVSVLARGLKIKCGCFGTVGETFVGPWNLVLDAALLAMALWFLLRRTEDRTNRVRGRTALQAEEPLLGGTAPSRVEEEA